MTRIEDGMVRFENTDIDGVVRVKVERSAQSVIGFGPRQREPSLVGVADARVRVEIERHGPFVAARVGDVGDVGVLTWGERTGAGSRVRRFTVRAVVSGWMSEVSESNGLVEKWTFVGDEVNSTTASALSEQVEE
ncbi:MAG: hypothetical protein AAGB34_06240 [Planctomycetota bacterium]